MMSSSNKFDAEGSSMSYEIDDLQTSECGLGDVLAVLNLLEYKLDGLKTQAQHDNSETMALLRAMQQKTYDLEMEFIRLKKKIVILVYVEAYTCPCIRYHPSGTSFVAQSNVNYIAIFSTRPPFKLDRYRRYEKHAVSGFPIKCNFSLDGEELASGSSDGCIYLYNYRKTELVRKIKAFEQACIDVAFHPSMPNVIASCSWSGDVSIFE